MKPLLEIIDTANEPNILNNIIDMVTIWVAGIYVYDISLYQQNDKTMKSEIIYKNRTIIALKPNVYSLMG
jgi:hypothetical protein